MKVPALALASISMSQARGITVKQDHYFKIDEASGIREVLVKFSRCGGHLLECNCPSA